VLLKRRLLQLRGAAEGGRVFVEADLVEALQLFCRCVLVVRRQVGSVCLFVLGLGLSFRLVLHLYLYCIRSALISPPSKPAPMVHCSEHSNPGIGPPVDPQRVLSALGADARQLATDRGGLARGVQGLTDRGPFKLREQRHRVACSAEPALT